MPWLRPCFRCRGTWWCGSTRPARPGTSPTWRRSFPGARLASCCRNAPARPTWRRWITIWRRWRWRTACRPVGVGVLALVTETAASLRSMDYAGSTPRLLGLCFGAEDLSADLGIAPRGPEGYAAPVRPPGPRPCWPRPGPASPRSTRHGPTRRTPRAWWRRPRKRRWTGSREALHPPGADRARQRRLHAPPERVAWARRVAAAFAQAPGAGVLTLDGAMIDQPHLKLARQDPGQHLG